MKVLVNRRAQANRGQLAWSISRLFLSALFAWSVMDHGLVPSVGGAGLLAQEAKAGSKKKDAAPGGARKREERRAKGANYPPELPGAIAEVYKKVGDVELKIWRFPPAGHQATDRRPAIVFFFGGGWTSGTPGQFEHQSRYLASRGMVALVADYRVASRHQVRAVDCVRDAKSAVRWVRREASRLGIDPARIAAGGGSAGGHLAAAAGVIPGLDEPGEDRSISSRPDALVLFNPAVVLAPVEGQPGVSGERLASLTSRLGVEPQQLSPYHHVAAKAPPTIIFHGESDSTVPFRTVELFRDAMLAAGNRCELVGYPRQEHGFFNHGRNQNVYYRQTVRRLDEFLLSLEYVQGPPTLSVAEDQAK